MWTRSVLKEKAKEAFAKSRWGLILCCLILSVVSGGFSGGGGNYTRSLQNYNNSGSSDAASTDAAQNYLGMFKSFSNGDISNEMLATILAVFIGVMAAAMVVGIILSVFVMNPLTIGCMRYQIEACYTPKKVGDLGLVGFVFKKGRYGNAIKTIFLMQLYEFLWTLLFIIPGIIKAYEYRMIPYIVAENPEIDTKKAFELSKEMMTGNKMDAFVLDLSFIGWHLLGILTCGILEIFYVMPYEYMTNAFLYDTLKQNASYNYFDRTIGAQAFGGSSANYSYGSYQPYGDEFNSDNQDAAGGYQEEPLPVDDPAQTGGWMPVYNPDQGNQSDQDTPDESNGNNV